MESPIRFWLAAIVLHAIVEENAAQLPVPVYVEPISLTGIAGQTCAADGDRQAAMDSLGSTIRGELQSTVVPFLTCMHPCGIGNWQRVFTLTLIKHVPATGHWIPARREHVQACLYSVFQHTATLQQEHTMKYVDGCQQHPHHAHCQCMGVHGVCTVFEQSRAQ